MKPCRGFTLIELMVTVILIAIVMSIAVPNFRDFIQDSRATSQANNIVGALNLARSEAIKRSETVSVCASSDQATCNAGSNWDQGWIVFVGDSSSLDLVLRVWDAPGDAVTVSSSEDTFSFDSLGEAEAGDGESIDVDFDACTEPWVRRVSVNAAGRVNVQRGNC